MASANVGFAMHYGHLLAGASAILLLCTSPTFAGSNSAEISCTGARRWKIEGRIPASEDEFDLTYSDGAGKLKINPRTGFAVNEDLAEFDGGRFEMIITNMETGKSFSVTSLGKSMKMTRGENLLRARFIATLKDGPITASPGKTHQPIRLSCRYDYSI